MLGFSYKEDRMIRKRYKAEQIIRLLRESDVKLSQIRNVGNIFPEMAIANLLNFAYAANPVY